LRTNNVWIKIVTGAWRWWTLALLVAMTDQAVKSIVHTLMFYGQSIPTTSFFNLVHAWNTGAAFSFLASAGGWQRYFFIMLTIGVSIWLAFMLRSPRGRAESLAYSLILGGALGNLADRILRGYVVDYLDFYIKEWHWPAFNLADSSITLGVFLLLWTTFNTTTEKTPSASRNRP
jgi:signal peptidase II